MVAYAVSAVVSAVGENKLMPPPDCVPVKSSMGDQDMCATTLAGLLIGLSKILRLGWMIASAHTWKLFLIRVRNSTREKNQKMRPRSPGPERPTQAGPCISIYKTGPAVPGHTGSDRVYILGFVTGFIQLGIAAIPCGLYGDWGVLLVTGSGIILCLAMGSLGQWKCEKWASRSNSSDKTVVLTRGNGSQHAIVILGTREGLDLEALATGPATVDLSTLWIFFCCGMIHNPIRLQILVILVSLVSPLPAFKGSAVLSL